MRCVFKPNDTTGGGKDRSLAESGHWWPIPAVSGLDAHAVMLAKGKVNADFVECVGLGDRLVLGIGDAPGYGLKSAFTARFIAVMFKRLVEVAQPLNLG